MILPVLLAQVAARWAHRQPPTCGWVPGESEIEMTDIREWETVDGGCECWRDPHPWGEFGIVEPGGEIAYNPGCPKHGEEVTP